MSANIQEPEKGQILFYHTDDQALRFEYRFVDELQREAMVTHCATVGGKKV